MIQPLSKSTLLPRLCALKAICLGMLTISAGAEEPKKAIALEDLVDIPSKRTFPSGIVFGPKAAFKISAPKGWVVDNEAGVQQGFPCVLYPAGSTWADADAVMYAKIASTNTTDRDAFVKFAIAKMREGDKEFRHARVAEGKTGDGHAYIINDYWHGAREDAARSQAERVAYVQLPGAVAFIVFTVASEELDKRHVSVVQEVVKSFSYAPKYIGFGTKKKAPARK